RFFLAFSSQVGRRQRNCAARLRDEERRRERTREETGGFQPLNVDILAIDALALATSSLALFFVARLKSTYFLGSRLFIALANLAFIILLIPNPAVDVGPLCTSERPS